MRHYTLTNFIHTISSPLQLIWREKIYLPDVEGTSANIIKTENSTNIIKLRILRSCWTYVEFFLLEMNNSVKLRCTILTNLTNIWNCNIT